ncbi:type II toxin-antitoxin system VapB family antitoxin [Bosea sp. LjRoot90]|uniref:type II toxin-antitoxin system VapB family antitoxin n=1 Tax=Bosea TaxID=85413 RepID=UPI0024DFC4BB|nr:type II toxin-antitoxin system VapB family antitoxin [Bosea vestrisii]WID96046.1 type II toxin-antitoxin system VapB family antitoxin [Bosea vestrisii]
MGILVRDEKIDRQVRELARQTGTSLQAAIGMAVERELARRADRMKRIEEATRKAQAMLADHPVIDDGMTHKEFFDREYGDA